MYKILSLQESAEWNRYLSMLKLEQRDVYFTPEYYSLYQSYGDGEALCFVYEENGEVILYPFLKNPIRPLGYHLEKEYYDIQGAYGYNGLVTSCREKAFIDNFNACFAQYCQEQSIIAEFSRFHPILNNHDLAPSETKMIYSRHTVYLDLTQAEDDIWMKQFSSKNRNMIRKAEKEGVTVVESNDYQTFQKLYNGTMANLHAEDYYFFPDRYYAEYQESFKGNSMLCLAMYDGKAIAGSMFMYSDSFAHYHLSARDRDYSRLAANNLILWYAIKKAKERGCKWFHFGGGTTGDDKDSLLQFKQNFSKEMGEFWIGKRVHNVGVYEQIVSEWKERYPESYENNRVKLLGYRDI